MELHTMSYQASQNHGGDETRKRDRPQILARKLLWFQIFMIGVSVTIGLGIFIRCGETLGVAGPAGTILAFGLVGILAICVMDGIAEMIEMWPVSNPFSEFVSAFVDPDLGIVVGFAYWYTYAVNFQSLLGAAASLISIWITDEAKLLLYQRTIFWFLSPILLLALNFMGVFWVGMVETVLGLAKIIFLVALFFLMIAVEYGGFGNNVKRSPVDCINDGFKANLTLTDNRFQAVLIAIPTAVFGFIGVETIAITAYEAKNRAQVKPPARLIAWCITGLYLLSAFGSVLSVSWTDFDLPRLYPDQKDNKASEVPCINPDKPRSSSYHATPPAIIALQNVNSTIGTNALTACLIFVVLSAANAALYVSSRTLFGLASSVDKNSQYPKRALTWLAFVTHDRGHRAGMSFGQIPAGALVFSVVIFCWLPFIEYAQLTDVLSSIGTVGSLLVWASQALAYIRFDYLRRKYGSSDLRRKTSRGQPLYAWIALLSSLIIVFILNTASWWQRGDDITPTRVLQVYIGPAVLLLLWILLKLFRSHPPRARTAKERFLSAVEDLQAKSEDLHDSSVLLLSRAPANWQESGMQHGEASFQQKESDDGWQHQNLPDLDGTDFRAYVQSRMTKT